jgi:glycosyltransferase involved in cell wall biosynthesis
VSSQVTILIVGQTPPPYGGQAIMIGELLRTEIPHVHFAHVPLKFSRSMQEVGRVRARKVIEVGKVVFLILWARILKGASILYYPPAGPHRVPVYRDLAVLLCTRWAFRKTIFHFHASGVSDFVKNARGLTAVLARRAYANPDLCIRTSPHNPEDGQAFHARADVVVYNGIPDVFPRFACLTRPTQPPWRLLFVGVLCESKGVLDLIRACGILLSRGRCFRLELVGGVQPASFADSLTAAITAEGLAEYVEIPGVLLGDDKWRAYRRSHIFCFPTFFESESFGLVLLEAMQFELPVVGARWRGVPSVVEDGKSGFLVEARDVTALADRLELLMQDRNLALSMGKAGRSRYLRDFSLERFRAEMRSVLHTLATQ